MVSVHSLIASPENNKTALEIISEGCEALQFEPNFIVTFYDESLDDQLLHDFLSTRFPSIPILGGTSCQGTMSNDGLQRNGAISVLLISDPDGEYGVGTAQLDGNIADAAEAALHRALANADCVGELPELVWIYQAPGNEEDVLEGLRRVLGGRCPIIGGTSADNHLVGKWRQISTDGTMSNSLVIGVMFSSGGISFAFQGGYEPTGHSGLVTEADGRRIISIDNEPAAVVYNSWSDGVISDKLKGGNVLMETTMRPIGVDTGKIDDFTHYLVAHPAAVTSEGGLRTFVRIDEGTTIYGMTGSKDRLIERAGRVATAAAAGLPGGAETLAGGLVVFCAGCRLAIDDQLDQVASIITEKFDGQPFVGCFTFGEQGQVFGQASHGNLMISAIAFGR